ncbi:hypothetical protein B0J11DRAFT_437315 [Dendryphion nanum]|uniref:Rhodopsin domain-containing protein n=1 Tax=Dendryphion nanum TaxID=256645 RepID=A0A9P9DP02_9PLEO|nr:hypothetical protein B0J11DRAFT_437315 [Dendryphion nanum]
MLIAPQDIVVWKLQLRLAHKIAITTIFALGLLNIVIAVFRITSLLSVAFRGDITYDVVPAMVWAVAQVSTAITLTCCLLLRPFFEKLVPQRLVRLAIVKPVPKPASIRVTTRIQVHGDTSQPRRQSCTHDGLQEREGPTFEITPGRSGSNCAIS